MVYPESLTMLVGIMTYKKLSYLLTHNDDLFKIYSTWFKGRM